MNTKNWSIQQAIKNRVDIEDRYSWAISNINTELPKYEKPPRIKLTAGVWNMVRGFINELRP